MREDGVGGDGEAIEGELPDGEVAARLGEHVEAGAEEEEERVDGDSRGDPSGGGRAGQHISQALRDEGGLA